jgi:hypothetical protein
MILSRQAVANSTGSRYSTLIVIEHKQKFHKARAADRNFVGVGVAASALNRGSATDLLL